MEAGVWLVGCAVRVVDRLQGCRRDSYVNISSGGMEWRDRFGHGWEVQLKIWPLGEVRWERRAQTKVTFQISGLDGGCCPLTNETTEQSCSLGVSDFVQLVVSTQDA